MSKLANAKRDLRQQINIFEGILLEETWNKVISVLVCKLHGKVSQKLYSKIFKEIGMTILNKKGRC